MGTFLTLAQEIGSNCSPSPQAKAVDSSTKTRAIFLLAAKQPPYHIYANPFYDYAGFGNIFAVDSSGGMAHNIQNYEYSPESSIHGMVFDSAEEYLYSADMWANRIWCHRKDMETGQLTTVGSLSAPRPGDHPRWVELHPKGSYLYALMEGGNALDVYAIDQKTHMPVYTQLSYPLVPPCAYRFHYNLKARSPLPANTSLLDLLTRNPKMYRSDVVVLSHSGKYLFATSRSNSPDVTGYISVFALTPEGAIARQMCLTPTPTSGGHSNAVAPCDWSDEWLAITDDDVGCLEIYHWDGEWLARVAKCRVEEPGFGMNAVWYD